MILRRAWTLAAAVAVLAGVGVVPGSARGAAASNEDLYRYATYGAAGVAVYGAVKKDPLMAGAGAVGAYLADRAWKHEVDRRHRYEYGYGRGRNRDWDRRDRGHDRGYYGRDYSYDRDYDRSGYGNGRGYDYGRDYSYDRSSGRDCDRGDYSRRRR